MPISKAHRGQSSNTYYQLVLDSIDDYAIFTTDKQGFVTSWNAGAQQVLGYDSAEIMGKNAALFFTASDLKKSAHKKELHDAKTYGSAIDERYHVRKDHSVFWAIGKMFPLFNAEKKHLGFTKVMRNINDSKLSKERLFQLKNYAEAIVANSRQPILVLTDEHHIYTANAAFHDLFNLSKKGTARKAISQVAKGLFDIPEIAGLLKQLKQSSDDIVNFKMEHDWPGIGKKYFLINASKLDHPLNSENLLLFSIQDMTEQRSLEQQKDDFISIASHEIRTPVTVIKAYAQILQKRAAEVNDQFLAATANKVNEKTEKLMAMVTYLLDASQLELGELIIRKSHFDLVDLVNESVAELKLIDKHEFVVKGQKECSVFADRIRISQVLNNLLNNASKYSAPELPVKINIKTNRKGDRIMVSVRDQGIGIPLSEQVNLFKRFWRANSATSRNISGIGLGLHVSHAIIRQHGGKLWLKSEKDAGSIFSFSLPV